MRKDLVSNIKKVRVTSISGTLILVGFSLFSAKSDEIVFNILPATLYLLMFSLLAMLAIYGEIRKLKTFDKLMSEIKEEIGDFDVNEVKVSILGYYIFRDDEFYEVFLDKRKKNIDFIIKNDNELIKVNGGTL